jgi:hypothetical protein
MSVYSEPWYREQVAKAERGNREHVARYERSFDGIMAKADDRENGDRNDGGGGGASDHALSRLADLTVESGKFSSRAEALNWLISHPNGHAFTRLHKAAETVKEQPMRTESLESILKDFGPVKLCKHIVETGDSPVGELDLVMSLSRHVGGDVAFSKLYESEEFVRKAIAIAKSAPWANDRPYVSSRTLTPADFAPRVVTGGEWQDADDAEQAWKQLAEIGRKMAPSATPEKQFALAFEDPKNLTLALRVYRRPQADGTGVYAMPPLPMPVARREKRDGAYAELMHKAEEYHSAHPELSVAQCFDKIYTDRANVELAKRERMESAPR